MIQKFLTFFLIFFIFFATGAVAAQQGNFPSDPRTGLPPTGIRTNTSSGPVEQIQSMEEPVPETSSETIKEDYFYNKYWDNNIVPMVVLGVIVFIIIIFLILIVFVLYSIHKGKMV